MQGGRNLQSVKKNKFSFFPWVATAYGLVNNLPIFAKTHG